VQIVQLDNERAIKAIKSGVSCAGASSIYKFVLHISVRYCSSVDDSQAMALHLQKYFVFEALYLNSLRSS
jgi:hypothetical protein